ncbi:hypothetical protein JW916_06700 [Candidatus Sumerlaeota bacterium]|nr:hypothetical protein [Candidatus Sumerlaeota bacterium]
MKKREVRVLFLGKEGDEHCAKALEFCEASFAEVTARLGQWGDPRPEVMDSWQGDYIVSYLSRWIVPASLLQRARIAAVNFHPASPAYPGIGCLNFALYEDAREYGVTCHHMAAKVDAGPIVAVKRFPILPSDNVASLLKRTYAHQLALFLEIASRIVEGKELPVSEEKWTRRPFTKKDLDELKRIDPGMSREEIERRIRATTFDKWRPFTQIEGFTFEIKIEPD